MSTFQGRERLTVAPDTYNHPAGRENLASSPMTKTGTEGPKRLSRVDPPGRLSRESPREDQRKVTQAGQSLAGTAALPQLSLSTAVTGRASVLRTDWSSLLSSLPGCSVPLLVSSWWPAWVLVSLIDGFHRLLDPTLPQDVLTCYLFASCTSSGAGTSAKSRGAGCSTSRRGWQPSRAFKGEAAVGGE